MPYFSSTSIFPQTSTITQKILTCFSSYVEGIQYFPINYDDSCWFFFSRWNVLYFPSSLIHSVFVCEHRLYFATWPFSHLWDDHLFFSPPRPAVKHFDWLLCVKHSLHSWVRLCVCAPAMSPSSLWTRFTQVLLKSLDSVFVKESNL